MKTLYWEINKTCKLKRSVATTRKIEAWQLNCFWPRIQGALGTATRVVARAKHQLLNILHNTHISMRTQEYQRWLTCGSVLLLLISSSEVFFAFT